MTGVGLLAAPLAYVVARRLGLDAPAALFGALVLIGAGGLALPFGPGPLPAAPAWPLVAGLVALVVLGAAHRVASREAEDGTPARVAEWLPGAIGLGLAVLGGGHFVAARTGLVWGEPLLSAALLEDAGVLGFPLVGLALALASLLSAQGRLRGRSGVVLGLGGVVLVHLALPGARAPWPLGTVLLGLLAADGFAAAPRAARAGAFALVAAGLALAGVHRFAGAPPVPPEEDELVGFARCASDGPEVEGWLHPAVPLEELSLVLARTADPADARRVGVELGSSPPVDAGLAPEGARWFRARVPDLPPGRWAARLEFHEGERVVAGRAAGVHVVPGPVGPALVGGLAAALALWTLLLPRLGARGRGVLLAVALVESLLPRLALLFAQ